MNDATVQGRWSYYCSRGVRSAPWGQHRQNYGMTRETYPSRDDENLSSVDAGSPSRTVLKLHRHIQESYIVTHFV